MRELVYAALCLTFLPTIQASDKVFSQDDKEKFSSLFREAFEKEPTNDPEADLDFAQHWLTKTGYPENCTTVEQAVMLYAEYLTAIKKNEKNSLNHPDWTQQDIRNNWLAKKGIFKPFTPKSSNNKLTEEMKAEILTEVQRSYPECKKDHIPLLFAKGGKTVSGAIAYAPEFFKDDAVSFAKKQENARACYEKEKEMKAVIFAEVRKSYPQCTEDHVRSLFVNGGGTVPGAIKYAPKFFKTLEQIQENEKIRHEGEMQYVPEFIQQLQEWTPNVEGEFSEDKCLAFIKKHRVSGALEAAIELHLNDMKTQYFNEPSKFNVTFMKNSSDSKKRERKDCSDEELNQVIEGFEAMGFQKQLSRDEACFVLTARHFNVQEAVELAVNTHTVFEKLNAMGFHVSPEESYVMLEDNNFDVAGAVQRGVDAHKLMDSLFVMGYEISEERARQFLQQSRGDIQGAIDAFFNSKDRELKKSENSILQFDLGQNDDRQEYPIISQEQVVSEFDWSTLEEFMEKISGDMGFPITKEEATEFLQQAQWDVKLATEAFFSKYFC